MAEKKSGKDTTEKKTGRRSAKQVPTSELPVIVIRELTLFPGMSMQFDLEKKPSVQAVEAAMLKDQQVFLVDQVSGEDDATMENLAGIGTIAEVQQVLKLHNGMMRIQVQGLYRGALKKLDKESSPYYTGDVLRAEEKELADSVKKEAARREMLQLFEQFNREFGNPDPRFIKTLKKIKPLGELADRIGANLPMGEQDKLRIL